MKESITIDTKQQPYGFDEYKKSNPQVNFLQMKIQNFDMDREYDLCFIDANHRYGHVKHDYEKVKDYCKFVAFHDILTVNSSKPEQKCVRHFWQELDVKNKIEIVTEDPRISFMSAIGIFFQKEI